MSQIKIKSHMQCILTIPHDGILIQLIPGDNLVNENTIKEAVKNAYFRDLLLSGDMGGLEITAAIGEDDSEIKTDHETAIKEFIDEKQIPTLLARMKAAAAKQIETSATIPSTEVK